MLIKNNESPHSSHIPDLKDFQVLSTDYDRIFTFGQYDVETDLFHNLFVGNFREACQSLHMLFLMVFR